MSNLEPFLILDWELDDINYGIKEILKDFDVQKKVNGNKNYAGGRMAGKTYAEVLS